VSKGDGVRIGFFTDTFLPQRNGVVTSLISFGLGLVRRGHEVFVFCPKTGIKNYHGLRVRSYRSMIFRPYPEFKIAFPTGKVPELDIVHTHSPFSLGALGLYAAKKQDIPRISTFHTILSEYVLYLRFGKELFKRLAWTYFRFYYNRCHRLIAPSEALKKVLRQHRIRKPIVVIPTGIDLSFYKPIEQQKARRRLGIKDERVFLCLGRLGFEKNLDVVLRAFQDVDARLIIAGRGPARKKLEEMGKGLGLRKKVSFAGYVRGELKPLYYSAADALISASTSETQAIVASEAMACGCPVIGADSLAIPEIVRDGKNGYLFEPGDSEGLSDLLSSFTPSKEMRLNALKSGRRFSAERSTNKLEKLYKSLL